jgi:uncharacterized protein (DUF488 family)
VGTARATAKPIASAAAEAAKAIVNPVVVVLPVNVDAAHVPPVFTIGHGTRPAEELVACLREVDARTLVDVRRFPGSRRNPQFAQAALTETLAEAGIAYRHAVELGGRLSGEPGEERFGCIRVAAFRSYAARMSSDVWQEALAAALAEPSPCFMCAETLWTRCHRRLIAELLVARGHSVTHLIRPGRHEPHRLYDESEVRDGRLYLCGSLVA